MVEELDINSWDDVTARIDSDTKEHSVDIHFINFMSDDVDGQVDILVQGEKVLRIYINDE